MVKPKRMNLQSADDAQLNIEALYQIAPSCFTEVENPSTGELKRMVNFDILRQLLGDNTFEGPKESYEFTWVGKQTAQRNAATPVEKTLRPCVEESLNWNSTENVYIEGDNREVLKLLLKSYLGKIKLVYIDPPYNTGEDILYKNDYSVSQEQYDKNATDDEGNRLYKNTESNGRFHSDWCSMMYESIKLAKSLIKDDGFFAIAIDHHELFNLGEICDEIFGYSNRIAIISVVHKPEGRNQAKYIGPSNEYLLLYIKDDTKAQIRKLPISDEQKAKFNLHDQKGNYYLENFIRTADGKYATREAKPDYWYPIWVSQNLKKLSIYEFEGAIPVYPVIENGTERTWTTLKDTCAERIDAGDIFAEKENEKIVVLQKVRDSVIKTHWVEKKYHGYHFGTKLLDNLLGVKTFDFPKSLYLMEDIFKILTKDDDIVLDFFSGSATSAHALMQLNSDDGGSRKFILVQIPASCDKKKEAFKAGYNNICEIAKERIRRAGKQIKEKSPLITQDLDVGFRVFKLDDSNFENIEHSPNEYTQDQLDLFKDNIKSDRTELDLLFGCMLDWGVQPSLPMASYKVDDKMVYTVNNGDLVACFDENVTENVVKAMAETQPLRVIFRDSCFNDDSDKINIYELFKQYAGWDDNEAMKNIRVI